MGTAPTWMVVVIVVVAVGAIDPGIVPKEHQILLVNKHGKRAIHNFGKVRMALKERFVTNVGERWFGDGIYKDTLASGAPKAKLVVTSFASMTMAEQLKMLAETVSRRHRHSRSTWRSRRSRCRRIFHTKIPGLSPAHFDFDFEAA